MLPLIFSHLFCLCTYLHLYLAAFDKVVFRRSHGKAFTRFVEAPYPLVDPTTGALTKKVVFYVVVLGKVLHRRIVNLARAFCKYLVVVVVAHCSTLIHGFTHHSLSHPFPYSPAIYTLLYDSSIILLL